MSAIAGILGLPFDGQCIQELLVTMARRGTGENGSNETKENCLLHAGGLQPMTVDWAGERYTITCDGELYNSQELRAKLLALGHSFYTDTDAEVLLRGYAQWQAGLLEKCSGIFAFVILEEKAERVFLARDRIGVKPLFFAEHKGGLLFASEIKTILTYPTMEAELDADGIGEILLLGPGRTPGSGVLKNIREMEPGCCGVYENGRLNVRRYWKLRDREHTESFEQTAEQVRALVLDAIGRQMTADVPIGTFLSGGLDSSLISAVCAGQLQAKGERLQTFSVDYVDNDKYFRAGKFQPNSDPEFIRIMQKAMDSDHHWTVISPKELVDGIEDAVIARDLPGMADVDASLQIFCRNISPHVRVALSGECADEIFGGYPWYRDPVMRDTEGFPWAQTTKERTGFLQPWILDKIDPDSFVFDRYRQTLAESDILPGNSPTDRRIKELVNLNFRWFMQTLIDRNDRMSAGSGLRVRTPMCDYRIAEYLYGVPWEYKDYQGREKGLLRHAMQDFLPEPVLWRKKSPYPKTHHPEYLRLVSGLLGEVLQDKNAPIFQIVSRSALDNLLQEDFAWPWYGQLMRRPQTIVYMLQINFWLKHYSVRIR